MAKRKETTKALSRKCEANDEILVDAQPSKRQKSSDKIPDRKPAPSKKEKTRNEANETTKPIKRQRMPTVEYS